MKYIEFEVRGERALFSDPLTRVGGEKMSYSIPTYSALVGICESIYWKPTLIWIIDSCRVIEKIKMQQYCINGRFQNKKGSNPQNKTYLTDVKYQVKAHFEWDLSREDLKADRDFNKHFAIAKRCLDRGGRLPVYLGTSDCTADVDECKFGSGDGYYDNDELISFGTMLHSINYSNAKHVLSETLFWNAKMNNGVIHFIKQKDCIYRRYTDMWNDRQHRLGKNLQPVAEFDTRKEFGDECLE